MAFSDFLGQTRRYRNKPAGIRRLDTRREFIVKPFVDDLQGARVLDLAAQDGRWTYALAEAGASEVIGVEARPELIEQYAEYPEGPVKDKTKLVVGDVFEALPRLASDGEKFDVVAIYGLFYHVMDHYRLLRQVAALEPRLVIIDSEFSTAKRALIDLFTEDPNQYRNTIAAVEGQSQTPIGIPSRRAVEVMARSLGYTTEWVDWDSLPQSERGSVADYFTDPATSRKRRGTCALRRA